MMAQQFFSKHNRLLLVFLILISLLPTGLTQAATRDGLSLVPGCEGFTSHGGGILLDRDNTGQGRETFTITATDGNGTVIFSTSESSFVGAEILMLAGLSFDYSTAPAANPIRLEVVSPAGNGLSEQMLYATFGSCSGLDFISTSGGSSTQTVVADFSPSPSVPLNGTAPRIGVTDKPEVAEPGYVIVTHVGTVNLRSGDGIEYTIVAQADPNDKLTVLGRNADRSWWFVSSGDIRGWVNATLVAVRGDLTNTPIAPVQGELLPPRLFIFREQPVYSAPESAIEICLIPGNLEYAIVGRNRGGTWYEITVDCGGEATGWISSEFGAFRNSGLSIPVTY